MAAKDTHAQLLLNTDTGESAVAIALELEGGRVIQAIYGATEARALAADLIRFADHCDAANARADAVAAQLLEKFMRQEGMA